VNVWNSCIHALEKECKMFGKYMGFGMVPYVYGLLGHRNDTLGMPFGMPRCQRLNQISYIRREFSLLEQELSLELGLC
jgi:hypothetical protein